MRKHIALTIIAFLFLLALVPAYCPVDDETPGPSTALSDAYHQVFSAITVFYHFDHHYTSTPLSFPKVAYRLTLHFPLQRESRAPPA